MSIVSWIGASNIERLTLAESVRTGFVLGLQAYGPLDEDRIVGIGVAPRQVVVPAPFHDCATNIGAPSVRIDAARILAVAVVVLSLAPDERSEAELLVFTVLIPVYSGSQLKKRW